MLAEEEIPVNFVSYLDDIPNLPLMPARIRSMRLETDEILDEPSEPRTPEITSLEELPDSNASFDTPSDGFVAEKIPIPLNEIIQPNKTGRYFSLRTPIAPVQQMHRIAICPPSSYPTLKMHRQPPKPVHLVTAEIVTVGLSCNFTQKILMEPWSFGTRCQLCKMKTPSLNCNQLEKAEGGEANVQFFFRILLFTENKIAGVPSYALVDQLTTSTFRTVSHSKLTDFKRRPPPKKNPKGAGRKPKRVKLSYSEEENSY